MRSWQIRNNIDSVIELHQAGSLSYKYQSRLITILDRHLIRSKNFMSLYDIMNDFIDDDLKTIAKLLICHGVFVTCGLCGEPIKQHLHYSVDHIIPVSKDGSNSLYNIQHSHIPCNSVKMNKENLLSFYHDDQQMLELYKESALFREFRHKVEIASENQANSRKIIYAYQNGR